MPTQTEMTPDQCRVAAMLSRLDYHLPPGDVTAAVMERIQAGQPTPAESQRTSWLRSAVRWLMTPQPWRIAPAAPLGAAFGVLFLVLVLGLGDPEGPGRDRGEVPGLTNQAEFAASSLLSEHGSDGPPLVVFTVRAGEARNVALIGTFNNWRDQGFEMRPVENQEGLWAIAVPLEQGRYEYAFLLNGERIMDDPQALLFKDDGFGNRNSVIIVEDHDHTHVYS